MKIGTTPMNADNLKKRRSPVLRLASCVAAIGVAVYGLGEAQARAPVALIKAHSGNGASAGTATLVAKHRFGYWLTASHVVDSPRISIHTPTHGFHGELVARDSSADLALVKTTAANCPAPVRIWTGAPHSSLDYYAEGYAGASFAGFGRRRGGLGALLGRMVRWTLPSIPGDSGGCVYTAYKGKRYLSSVVSGSNWPGRSRNADGYTVGASPEAIRTFLCSAGLTVEDTGVCIPRTLGGRQWRDPIQGGT